VVDQVSACRHVSFLPASFVTLILAPFGLGFAPPPPLADTGATAAVRRSGVIVLGVVALTYCLSAWTTAVPVARTCATAALILLSSALVPITPLDGAHLGLKKWADLAITLALAVFTLLFALGVI
jgi:hypothetical protein